MVKRTKEIHAKSKGNGISIFRCFLITERSLKMQRFSDLLHWLCLNQKILTTPLSLLQECGPFDIGSMPTAVAD